MLAINYLAIVVALTLAHSVTQSSQAAIEVTWVLLDHISTSSTHIYFVVAVVLLDKMLFHAIFCSMHISAIIHKHMASASYLYFKIEDYKLKKILFEWFNWFHTTIFIPYSLLLQWFQIQLICSLKKTVHRNNGRKSYYLIIVLDRPYNSWRIHRNLIERHEK